MKGLFLMPNNRCTYDQRYDKALEIYLKLRHKDVYQLIHKHNLFASIEDKIVLLMDFDKEVKVIRDSLAPSLLQIFLNAFLIFALPESC